MDHGARKVAIREAFLEQKLRFYIGNPIDMLFLVLCSLNGSATIVLPSTAADGGHRSTTEHGFESDRRIA
jgi:hypothetical protein